MRNRLLIFGRFADDSQSILAAVHRLALMGIKLCLNVSLELSVALLADAKTLFHNSQFALRHGRSLAHLATRAETL